MSHVTNDGEQKYHEFTSKRLYMLLTAWADVLNETPIAHMCVRSIGKNKSHSNGCYNIFSNGDNHYEEEKVVDAASLVFN